MAGSDFAWWKKLTRPTMAFRGVPVSRRTAALPLVCSTTNDINADPIPPARLAPRPRNQAARKLTRHLRGHPSPEESVPTLPAWGQVVRCSLVDVVQRVISHVDLVGRDKDQSATRICGLPNEPASSNGPRYWE